MDFLRRLRGLVDRLVAEATASLHRELLAYAINERGIETCGHANPKWASPRGTLVCDECDWYERMEDKAQDFMWWAVRR